MSFVPFVLVYNLTPEELKDECLERIEQAILVAFDRIVPDMKLDPDSVGFSFPQDPSVKNISQDIPVLIIIEGLRDNLDRRDNLAEEIAKYFKSASPKEGRRVKVIVRRPHEYDGEYDE